MMKDEHKKIYWQTGLEITPDTFIASDNYVSAQQNLIRKLVNLQYYGLLPVSDASAPSLIVNASMNGSEISIEHLFCNGVTRDGYLIQCNNEHLPALRRQRLTVAGRSSGYSYVVLRTIPFEQTLVEPVENEETPFALPVYELDVKELTQIGGNELAILRIECSPYSSRIDLNYIPPCMAIRSHEKLIEQYRLMMQAVDRILKAMLGKKSEYQQVLYPFTMLLFDLEQFSPHNPPYYLVQTLKKTIKTVDFFVKSSQWNLTEVMNIPYIHDDIDLMLQALAKCFQDIQIFIGKATVVKEKEEDFTPRI